MSKPNFNIAIKKLLQFEHLPILVLLVVSLVTGLIIAKDYGQSWDEPNIYRYGNYVLNAYQYFFHPQSLPDYGTNPQAAPDSGGNNMSDLNFYGPSYFIVATILSKIFLRLVPGWTIIIAWHFVNFITFQIGVVIFYFLAKRWMSSFAAFGAALLLSVQPLFWGHAFINPKDIPFAVFFLASVYFGLNMMDSPSAPKSILVIWAGIILGATTSFRITGPFAGVLVFLYGLSKSPRKAVLTTIPYFLIAVLTSYLAWPYLWKSPIHHFIDSIRYMSDFPYAHPVLFAGNLYSATHLPWSYVPILLCLQLTEPLLILLILGFGVSIWRFVKKGQREPALIFSLWFLLPTIAIILSGSALYDNARQLFFLLPPLFILAGLALDELLSRFNHAVVKALAIGLIILASIIPMIQLHPYEYIYYNSFIGGAKGAFRNFETDYWDTSFKDAAQYLNANAPYHSRVVVFDLPIHILDAYTRPDLQIYNNEKTHYANFPYAVLSTRLNLDESSCPNGQVVATVSRDDVILAVIKKLPAGTHCE